MHEEVIPAADAWESSGEVPREILRRMGALGMLGIRYSARYGGAELDALASVVLAEELGRSTYGGFAITVLTRTDTASPPIARFGTPEQQDRFMEAIVRADMLVAIAMTEPEAGSDLGGIRTSASRDGDDYVLTGTKHFITNGVNADLYVVVARTDWSVNRRAECQCFSSPNAWPAPPAPARRSTVCCASPAAMSRTATCAPGCARAMAIARPSLFRHR